LQALEELPDGSYRLTVTLLGQEVKFDLSKDSKAPGAKKLKQQVEDIGVLLQQLIDTVRAAHAAKDGASPAAPAKTAEGTSAAVIIPSPPAAPATAVVYPSARGFSDGAASQRSPEDVPARETQNISDPIFAHPELIDVEARRSFGPADWLAAIDEAFSTDLDNANGEDLHQEDTDPSLVAAGAF